MSYLQIKKSVETAEHILTTPHEHNYYELYFTLEGERIYYIDGVSYTIKPNSIVLVPPQSKHLTSGSVYSRYVISIAPENLTEYHKYVLEKYMFQHIIQLPPKSVGKALSLFEDLEKTPDNVEFADEIQKILFSTIILIIDKLKNAITEVKRLNVPVIVYKIMNYIENNYSEKLSLQSIAKQFNYSVANIRKQFKKSLDTTINDYIINLRIAKAKTMLSTTKMSMSEISEKCGFSSANYFSLIFKEKEGISPAYYRKNNI